MYWKSALSIPYSPLMDCYFYTSANGEWQVAVYTLLFFFIVSINGLLLLHIYKRRMGCEPYMPYGFPSLSPLTDCYLYTSANGEFNISVSERVRGPFVSDYPYFNIRLYCYSVIALSG